MTTDPIPDATPEDRAIDLRGHWLSIRAHENYSNAHHEGNKKVFLILGAVIRRCHAAERELDALRKLIDDNAASHAEIHEAAIRRRKELEAEVERLTDLANVNEAACRHNFRLAVDAEQRIADLEADIAAKAP